MLKRNDLFESKKQEFLNKLNKYKDKLLIVNNNDVDYILDLIAEKGD